MHLISEQQRKAFDRDGFLVIDQVFDPELHLEPVRLEYRELLQKWVDRWIDENKLPEFISALPFEQQIIEVYRAGLDYCQPLDISLPPGNVSSNTPFHAGEAIFNLMTADALLDVIESFLGPELTSNPIQHVRIKPPQSIVHSEESRSFITATDWHQDRATALSDADSTQMITAWIAMTDATPANGCLQVIPGSHLQSLKTHCPVPQLGIPDSLIDEAVALPVPVPAGGMILFHPLTIHGSLNNQTQSVRWSFDLRFHVTGHSSGRPMFPSFIARSRSAPSSELRDANAWNDMWLGARDKLSRQSPVKIHRWSASAPVCA